MNEIIDKYKQLATNLDEYLEYLYVTGQLDESAADEIKLNLSVSGTSDEDE